MQRICNTLAANGFEVTLVGRKMYNSIVLAEQSFKQKRLRCFFQSGFTFYVEYNIRLFFYLLFKKADILYAVDLDTILPVYFASAIKGKKKIYDAHELFTEQKEIITRPTVHKFWLAIERFTVPKFKYGYTVNIFIKEELRRRYNVDYSIIRNLPKYYSLTPSLCGEGLGMRFVIYQGAVNEGRSFETLIPALKQVDAPLKIYGKGNFFEQTKQLIITNKLEDKIELAGYVVPLQLKKLTQQAYIGLTLFEKTGLNQYYSLSNRFFDYIMAGIPQVCVNYPEYKAINDEYNIALMIDDTNEQTIADALNRLLNDNILYEQLKQNCVIAREQLNWQSEEKKLIAFFSLINPS
ncbi:glycosyltransferase family 4 protein [Panacibacter ginsenosidivorans]|uniref:Glycosyltransferase family 4 protein n=2 Tax=Panacibacter ginsenosidivorans TaxID=1813871 RepID=A0A5B8VF29_9BACT|nr:glycosyltransferase family 4 protein [Panacibacter ginsenosidivorans]